MLSWTITFLIISFIVGLFGFMTDLAGGVAGLAQALFVIFMILLVISCRYRFPTRKNS